MAAPTSEPNWGSAPAWVLPTWGEPVIVASILIGAMIFNRKRNFAIFDKRTSKYGLLDEYRDLDSARSSDELLSPDYRDTNKYEDDEWIETISTMKNAPKRRRCCCVIIYTPNTSRFADYYHSRLLQKFPFLMEIFYWIITYGFYRCTRVLAEAISMKRGILSLAEGHGHAILKFEDASLHYLLPHEVSVQRWFLHGHQTFLTVLNRSYALIHIPGTVGFLGWWYYVAPSHNTFAIVRRTMTLTNLLAFIIFVCYPCMPPRLMPPEVGFLDTVGRNNAQSVWMKGHYVNTLAAMPSMHFAYAFCIGVTLLHHSGVFRRTLEPGERRKSKLSALFYVLLAFGYPSFILLTIVATANHYYLDAIVGFFVAIFGYHGNRVFMGLLPLEDLLLWCLRLEKPVPTTGHRI